MAFFSLIIPTRDRDVLRQQQLESIRHNTINYNNIEIIYVIDKGDDITESHLNSLKSQFSDLNIRWYKRNRSYFLQRDYYNWACGFADGDFYWILGDDVMFTYKNWDGEIIRKINDYLAGKPDRICCVSVKDNTPKPRTDFPPFPCFPLVSKEATKALFAMPHNVPTWGADTVMYYIYTKINRLLVIDDLVYLNHISYHTRQAIEDKIALRMGTIFNTLKMRREFNTDRIIQEYVPLWAEYLQCIIDGRIQLNV